jgi:hypothetical protein
MVFRPTPFSGIWPFGVSLSMGASMARVSVALLFIAFTHIASAADLNKPAAASAAPELFSDLIY